MSNFVSDQEKSFCKMAKMVLICRHLSLNWVCPAGHITLAVASRKMLDPRAPKIIDQFSWKTATSDAMLFDTKKLQTKHHCSPLLVVLIDLLILIINLHN